MPYHNALLWLGRYCGKLVKVDVTKRIEMLLVTVAYNEAGLIEWQIDQIRKHVKDESYSMLVVDNSTICRRRKKIRAICNQKGIAYVAVPRWLNRLVFTKLFWFGNSHGMALNWVYYHVLRAIKPQRFALLDHDLIPFRDCNLTKTLGPRPFLWCWP